MLYIYKNFELQGVLSSYTLQWTRRFTDIGEFALTIPFSMENWQLLQPDSVVYKKDTDEAAIILDRNIFRDALGNEKIIIKGPFLSYILGLRVINYAGTVSLQKALVDIVTQNMISATNTKRNIAGLLIGASILQNNPALTLDMKNVDSKEAIKGLAEQYQVGWRVRYRPDNRQYVMELYEGRDSVDVVFSYQFGNVLEQEYWQTTSHHKNTCLVDNNGAITTVGDANVGLNRKEIYTSLNTSSTASAMEQGQLFLQSYRPIESMDTVIDTNSIQFKYLEDWDLGDIVSCKNDKWGVTIQRNILEIEEYHDTTGKYLTVVFGDYIPTTKERK